MLSMRTQDFIRVEGLIRQLWVLLVCLERLFANDVGDKVVDQFGLRLSLPLESERHGHVRE